MALDTEGTVLNLIAGPGREQLLTAHQPKKELKTFGGWSHLDKCAKEALMKVPRNRETYKVAFNFNVFRSTGYGKNKRK